MASSSFDGVTLLILAREIGEFALEGTPLVFVSGSGGVDDDMTAKLNAAYLIVRQCTLEKDAVFGIRQIVYIVLKALSPGINDTTMVVICVDYLTAILARFSARRIAS